MKSLIFSLAIAVGLFHNYNLYPPSLIARHADCDNSQLNHRDTDAVLAILAGTCAGGTFGNYHLGRLRHHRCLLLTDRRAVCTRQSILEAVKWVTQKCGVYRAGSYTGDGYAYGYTDYLQHDFCNIVLEPNGPCMA